MPLIKSTIRLDSPETLGATISVLGAVLSNGFSLRPIKLTDSKLFFLKIGHELTCKKTKLNPSWNNSCHYATYHDLVKGIEKEKHIHAILNQIYRKRGQPNEPFAIQQLDCAFSYRKKWRPFSPLYNITLNYQADPTSPNTGTFSLAVSTSGGKEELCHNIHNQVMEIMKRTSAPPAHHL